MKIKKLKIIILFTIIILLVNLTINELIINRNNYNSQNELLPTSLSNLTKINNVKNLQDKYQNTDIKGILSIDKEELQYPVVQTLDNNYYLNHNYYKENDKLGSIYLDYRVDLNKSQKILRYPLYPFLFSPFKLKEK